jgi:alkyl sulfatase BDS1-like metallo-beta-lactamase superfamily hydrolase
LPAGPKGHVDCGLGKAIPFWPPGLIAPTEDITATGTELVVDGVRIAFQLTPETEAPSEMNFFFPDKGWLCTAENCTHTMHNLVPIRGALVRDSLNWSKYIAEMIELFGARTELMFASHNWPRWGNENVLVYLGLQRDLYRWMHDQTMRHANQGLNAVEIAEVLTLPPEFAAEAHTTGYYGSLVHNVKAVFQRYLSWYDGNPANLWRLPPTDAGRRYVDLAGGPEHMLASARRAFDAGDYRWVAELLNHLVFADPTNVEGRELQADALEQLGYQSESATFRNAFLTGAQELRNGTMQSRPAGRSGYHEAMTIDQIFDSLAVRLKAEEVGGLAVSINFTFIDLDQRWVLRLSNRALHAVPDRHDDEAAVSLRLTRPMLLRLSDAAVTIADAVEAGDVGADGDLAAADAVFAHLDVFMTNFALVEP